MVRTVDQQAQWLSLKIGHEDFAINVQYIRELIPRQTVTARNLTDQSIEGFTYFRDQVLSVINGVIKLGVDYPRSQADEGGLFVIFDVSPQPFALSVTAVGNIFELSPRDIAPYSVSNNPAITGVARRTCGGLMLVLDPTKLIELRE
ncbi:chemotaxis protein CheW [Pseudoalteromonas umbrosa]|uniref:chemotaxis protein CheW n=1 Tax=Pseudoalteromonas umbrosa TaxID=3048489 RepID=UPI0024C2DA98|nr:chemotaxis protein CheW [Pseudoalteromonas sp. B95]MDK1290199.1 chemotaxis protein CheW [Pseudoalteromonas sp. B95]